MTQTAPRDWWEEPDEVLATVLDVLERQAEAASKARRKVNKGSRRG